MAVGPLQQTHRRQRAQDPRKLAHLRDVALPPEYAFFRIQTAGEPVESDLERVAPAFGRIENRRHRMIVGDKKEAFAVLLGFDRGSHRTEIVSDVHGS